MGKWIFSYKNWALVYGISPFMLEPDKEKVREKCDGQEVNYDEERDMFTYYSPWGPQVTNGRFCLKKEGEADHTIEEIKKSPNLQRDLVRLIRKDYLFTPFAFQMPAYIKAKDGTCGFAMVSVSGESIDQMICHFSLDTNISKLSAEMNAKMNDGLLDKYFSCFAVGVLKTGAYSNAKVYLTSVDRLALCVKELTGNDKAHEIDYKKLDQYLTHYDEVSPEIEEEEVWYLALVFEIMHDIDPDFGNDAFERFLEEVDDDLEYLPENRGKMGSDMINTVKNVQIHKGSKKDKIIELMAQGLTIGQIAKKLGMSYQAVSKEWNKS